MGCYGWDDTKNQVKINQLKKLNTNWDVKLAREFTMYQKVYNISKSLEEFCNSVHRLIKNDYIKECPIPSSYQ